LYPEPNSDQFSFQSTYSTTYRFSSYLPKNTRIGSLITGVRDVFANDPDVVAENSVVFNIDLKKLTSAYSLYIDKFLEICADPRSNRQNNGKPV
jgi:hypothetical protein